MTQVLCFGQGRGVSGFEWPFEEMTVLFLKRTTLFPVDPAPSRGLGFWKTLKKIPRF